MQIHCNQTSRALVFALLFACGRAGGDEPKKASTKIVVTGTTLTFDPKTCTEGTAGFFWALGSAYVTVRGHDAGKCVFDYKWEVEGGGNYQVDRVRVPTDSGPVVIEANRDRGEKKNHWSHIYTSFTKEQAQLVRTLSFGWTADRVDGTEEFVTWRTAVRVEAGKGSAAAKGDKLTVRFGVYQDGKFDRRAPGAKQGQTVEFTVGAVKAWKWLELAAAEMKVGEKRQIKLPAKVAEGAKNWLPNLKPGETLNLEMELIKADRGKR